MKIGLTLILVIGCLCLTQVSTTQYVCNLANGCQSCWNGSICSTCVTGYNNRQWVCNQCTDAHCKFCFANVICSSCVSYYGVNGTTCSPCASYGCTNCTFDFNFCYYCNVVKLGPNNGVCVACADPHCTVCRTDYTVCEYCDTGYGKYFGNASDLCTPCTLAFCGVCTVNHNICDKCVNVYGFTAGPNSTCIPCQDPNCISCFPSAYSCDQCAPFYGVDSSPNRICLLCTFSDPNCLYCGISVFNCTQCQPGYSFNPATITVANNGTCETCYIYCATCAWNNTFQCLTCFPDRFLNAVNHTCDSCSVGCQYCTNITICITCSGDYYKVSGLCVPCPDFCLACHVNTTYNLPECTSCNATSRGLNVFHPPVCKESICGDSVTTTLDCDNALGEPYDGCDDNCEIMPDFLCNVTNGSTVCSYTQPLQLSFVQLKRSGSSNNFKLTLAVQPPLYVLKESGQSEISALFNLSVPNFTIGGVVYNAQDGTLEYDMELTDDLADTHFTLSFNTGSSIRPDYFATPNVTVTLQLDFGGLERLSVVSKEQKVLAPLLQYLCWGILALGWLGCILGLFMRRLSGLEAMFVVQVGWISILLLQTPLTYPFTQVWPLRYSAGPNYPIGGADTKESVTPPHFAEFRLSSSLFHTNFNFCALLQLLSLLAVIICYLRIRVFRAQHKLTGREIYLKEPLDEPARTLCNRHEFAEQCLIYFSLLNVIYFVNCAVLFLKFGTRTNIVSIAAIALQAVLLLVVIGRFWFYPDPCDYFRYSFRKTALALSHYYIKTAFLILESVLMSPLVNSPFAAMAPCLVLLIYTVAYRPYQDGCENIRAVFNLITMCAFCGLRLYCQYVPSSKLNTLSTYLLLTACMALLLVVVLFGLAATVYFFHHYNYRLPMLARELDESDEVACKKEILRELTAIHPNKHMRVVEDGANYKRVIAADKSLRVFSNNLQEHTPGEVKDYQEVSLILNISGADSPSTLLHSPRKLLKQEMLWDHKESQQKDDGIVRGFDKVTTNNIEKQKTRNKPTLVIDTEKVNEETTKNDNEPKKLLDQIAKEVAKDENEFINLSAAVTYFQEELKPPLDNKADIYEQAYDNIPSF